MVDSSFLSIITRFSKLVDAEGQPTDFLLRYLQERGGALTDLDGTITALDLRVDNIEAIDILSADSSVDITNGSLGDATDVDLSVDEQVVLDAVGDTRGSILYRGAAGWAILTPGTSGHFLKSNGAGADPSYASAGGGGGGSDGFEAAAPDVPVATGWTWINQSTATLTAGDNMIYAELPDSSGNYRAVVQAAPSTPYDVYVRMDLLSIANITFADLGVIVRNNSSTDAIALIIQLQAATPAHYVRRMTGTLGAGGTVVSGTHAIEVHSIPKWLRIENDGTNLNFYISLDGINWFQTYTETLAAFVGTADEIGLLFRNSGTAGNAKLCFYNFGTNAPSAW